MARRVFFSFHYQRDIFRVSQVRNSGITKAGYDEAGFIDHADWETLERDGDEAIRRWIDRQLEGSSVTVVLIGAETAGREWVNYEIKKSYQEGKGMLGVFIHQLIDPRTRLGDSKGLNPFASLYVENSGRRTYLSEIYPSYDWIDDDGYNNFADWVEAAAAAAGR